MLRSKRDLFVNKHSPDWILKYHLHTPETNISSLFSASQCTLSPLEPSGYHAAQPLSQIIPYYAPNMSLHTASSP